MHRHHLALRYAASTYALEPAYRSLWSQKRFVRGSLRGEPLRELGNDCDVLARPAPEVDVREGLTVQGDHGDDETNRENHDNEWVDLETRRFVRV